MLIKTGLHLTWSVKDVCEENHKVLPKDKTWVKGDVPWTRRGKPSIIKPSISPSHSNKIILKSIYLEDKLYNRSCEEKRCGTCID